MNQPKLIIVTAAFLVAFFNLAFFQNLTAIYPLNLENGLFIASLAVFFTSVNTILFSLLCFKRTTKPVLIGILLASSMAAYFMDTYNVIVNDEMLDNMVKTDINETLDLFSLKQLLYFVFLGLLPSFVIYKIKLHETTLKKALFSNLILLGGSLAVIVVIMLSLSGFYASFIREHKPLRYYANPSYFIYSGIKYTKALFKSGPEKLKTIGLDAAIPLSDVHRELIVMVVGETARSDRFSLNGYAKKTNPLLEKLNVLSFTNVWACGTSTAYSLPCMFSIYDRDKFTKEKAQASENVLDVLQRAGVNVLWLDNNSSSKGVADRVRYESYKTSENNTNCDIECRDTGMLTNLQTYINQHPTGDIFIVLHQMGSHGPAYHKRYPQEFEIFTPTCQTNRLDQCSPDEINNTYDNTIVYTDYFLSKTIALLNSYDNNNKFEAALIYIGDHGESLGEDNLYLHGLPYLIAPDTQTHVPLIMWFNKSFEEDEINFDTLKTQTNKELSHDNLFHTILGLMEIKSTVYDKSMDIIDHDEEYEH